MTSTRQNGQILQLFGMQPGQQLNLYEKHATYKSDINISSMNGDAFLNAIDVNYNASESIVILHELDEAIPYLQSKKTLYYVCCNIITVNTGVLERLK